MKLSMLIFWQQQANKIKNKTREIFHSFFSPVNVQTDMGTGVIGGSLQKHREQDRRGVLQQCNDAKEGGPLAGWCNTDYI